MPLQKRLSAFDDPSWFFEVKYDGFRALAHVGDQCRLVSRNAHAFGSFGDLNQEVAYFPPA